MTGIENSVPMLALTTRGCVIRTRRSVSTTADAPAPSAQRIRTPRLPISSKPSGRSRCRSCCRRRGLRGAGSQRSDRGQTVGASFSTIRRSSRSLTCNTTAPAAMSSASRSSVSSPRTKALHTNTASMGTDASRACRIAHRPSSVTVPVLVPDRFLLTCRYSRTRGCELPAFASSPRCENATDGPPVHEGRRSRARRGSLHAEAGDASSLPPLPPTQWWKRRKPKRWRRRLRTPRPHPGRGRHGTARRELYREGRSRSTRICPPFRGSAGRAKNSSAVPSTSRLRSRGP